MIRDIRTSGAPELLDADVCIVGAGAAGIAIAREFISTPYRVILLESGGYSAGVIIGGDQSDGILDKICPVQQMLARGQLVGHVAEEQSASLGLQVADGTAQENNDSGVSSR